MFVCPLSDIGQPRAVFLLLPIPYEMRRLLSWRGVYFHHFGGPLRYWITTERAVENPGTLASRAVSGWVAA
jgi:hypothetical protein